MDRGLKDTKRGGTPLKKDILQRKGKVGIESLRDACPALYNQLRGEGFSGEIPLHRLRPEEL